VLIIRRINYINTTSGIRHYVGDRLVCKSGSSCVTCILDDHLHRVACTRYCIDTVNSPDDEHGVARNMYRIVINIQEKRTVRQVGYLLELQHCPLVGSDAVITINGESIRITFFTLFLKTGLMMVS
jgi:hypothetical protein